MMLPKEQEEKVRALLWRILYAAICFVLFWWIFPMFLEVLGVNPVNALLMLIKACTAAIAILYVLFGPPPPSPF